MTTCWNILNLCLQNFVVKAGGFLSYDIFWVKINSYVASPGSKPSHPSTNFQHCETLSHVGLQFWGSPSLPPHDSGNLMPFRPVLCWTLTQRRCLTGAFVLEFIGLRRLHKATIVWPVNHFGIESMSRTGELRSGPNLKLHSNFNCIQSLLFSLSLSESRGEKKRERELVPCPTRFNGKKPSRCHRNSMIKVLTLWSSTAWSVHVGNRVHWSNWSASVLKKSCWIFEVKLRVSCSCWNSTSPKEACKLSTDRRFIGDCCRFALKEFTLCMWTGPGSSCGTSHIGITTKVNGSLRWNFSLKCYWWAFSQTSLHMVLLSVLARNEMNLID